MSTKVNNANKSANNVNNANKSNTPNSYEVKGVKITRITSERDNPRKLRIEVSGEPFPTIDMQTGQEQNTNAFGKAITATVRECGATVPLLSLADTLSMGKTLNPQIVALCLLGATIDIKRTLRTPEDSRWDGSAYSQNAYTTDITRCTPSTNKTFEPIIMELIKTALILEEKPAQMSAADMIAALNS